MPSAAVADSLARRQRVFQLLGAAKGHGAQFARLRDVDQCVDLARAAMFLKHDVHAVPLEPLMEFAAREREMGAQATYFFMVADHPLTRPAYSFTQQARAMRTIEDMGHEIALHIDPYFLMAHMNMPLSEIVRQTLGQFRAEGIEVVSGNLHGNSKYKMPDVHGNPTSCDLFAELMRQRGFPSLPDVPQATAETIRKNQVQLADYELRHWGDLPMWSARHGHVVTIYLTDNWLEKLGTLEIIMQPQTAGQYKLCDTQPPDPRLSGEPRRIVTCKTPPGEPDLPIGSHRMRMDDIECAQWIKRLAGHPVLVLLHPQFYC